MSAKRISLDANILFYAIDSDAGERHHLAQEVVARAARELDCVLTLQALCEFVAAATRKGKLSIAQAAEQVADWQILFPVVSTRPESLHRALQAVEQHNLSFWDALLWAVAREAGVQLLLSEDFQHQRVLDGVQFWNPFLTPPPPH